MLTANEPKKKYQLSPPTPALLAPLLHLSKLWAPTSLPWGRTEGEGRGQAVSSPAAWHSPAGSSGSLPLCVFSSHTHQHPFFTLVMSLAPTSTLSPPPPPLDWLASLEHVFYFLPWWISWHSSPCHTLDGAAYPLNSRGDHFSLANMECRWLQTLPIAHGDVRPFGLWEKCQKWPEENIRIPSLERKDGAGGKVPVTPGGKTRACMSSSTGGANSDTSGAGQIRQMWETSLCKITGRASCRGSAECTPLQRACKFSLKKNLYSEKSIHGPLYRGCWFCRPWKTASIWRREADTWVSILNSVTYLLPNCGNVTSPSKHPLPSYEMLWLTALLGGYRSSSVMSPAHCLAHRGANTRWVPLLWSLPETSLSLGR